MVNYEIFVKSIIRNLSGASASHLDTIDLKTSQEYRLKPGRQTVILGSCDNSHFTPLPQQSPGMVSPLPLADGLVITLDNVSLLKEGDIVRVLPIKWELYSEAKRDIFTASS